jgi:hypothetical protein
MSGTPEKIEQEASGDCRYSEYLTLLNTSQDGTTRERQSPGECDLWEVVDSPPQMIDEKELYGC